MPRVNSQNRSIGDKITAVRLQNINQDLDDLYANWDDRLKVFVVDWLEVEIAPGNYRVGNDEWVFVGDTVILDDDTVSYIMLNSGWEIQVSTTAWDVNFARLAKVTTLDWNVTDIEIRKQDVVWGQLGGSAGFKNVSWMVYNTKQQLTEFVADWTTYTLTYNPNWTINTISNGALIWTMSYDSIWNLSGTVESSV